MRNKKLIKSIIAFIFVFGLILSNLSSVFVKAEGESTSVVVHKLELTALDSSVWPKKPGADGTISGLNNHKYDGSAITDIVGYFGQGTKELDDVEFFYWKVTKEQYDYMLKTPANYDTLAKVEAFFDKKDGDTDFNATAGKTSKDSKLSAKTANERGFEVTLADGYYWFVENLGSQLKNTNAGKTLSKAAAVPFGLALPVFKADGSRFTNTDKLHVYPKNTLADKPKTDKNFEDGDINLNDNTRGKTGKNVFAGQEVPFKVVTEIPAGADYKTVYWNDQMTEGLTFDNTQLSGLKVKISKNVPADDNNSSDNNFEDFDGQYYTKSKDGNGFKVSLTADGLTKLKEIVATNKAVIKLEYSAVVNDKAIVEIPEANDVTFHYGNNPSNGNTPKPNKPNPNDSSITVEKTWASGGFPAGVTATMQLFNAQTGVKVGNDIVLSATKTSHKWTNLDKDIEYKVVEVWNGYTPEYTVTNDGKTTVRNHKEDNPEPQNPSEPRVESGGKRFQKVDSISKAGLQGAEFYVTKSEQSATKYLAKKTPAQNDLDQLSYVTAEKAYRDAVKAGQPDTAELKKTRDDAYKVVNTQWKWIEEGEKANAFVVTSGEDGYFKVTGLAYGNYALVEKTAPTGYAKITTPVPFNVNNNSKNETTKLDTGLLDNGLQTIDNKKITIPQTGGIGTVIFTVVGVLVMGSAVVAMRRRKTEEE